MRTRSITTLDTQSFRRVADGNRYVRNSRAREVLSWRKVVYRTGRRSRRHLEIGFLAAHFDSAWMSRGSSCGQVWDQSDCRRNRRVRSEIRTYPSFDPSFSEIADLREAADIDLQADEFLKLADEVDPFSQEAKRAFVAKTSEQNHAARMHKIL